jgi:CxxC motif-containing protein
MKKEFICIVCPNSCRIAVEYDGQEIKHIEGAQCKKGEEFIRNEIKNPLRTFTGSVKCKNGDYQLVSVKTNKPIPKKYIKQVAQKTHELVVEAPVEIGQVIVNNIISYDVNLVATRMVRKKGENYD